MLRGVAVAAPKDSQDCDITMGCPMTGLLRPQLEATYHRVRQTCGMGVSASSGSAEPVARSNLLGSRGDCPRTHPDDTNFPPCHFERRPLRRHRLSRAYLVEGTSSGQKRRLVSIVTMHTKTRRLLNTFLDIEVANAVKMPKRCFAPPRVIVHILLQEQVSSAAPNPWRSRARNGPQQRDKPSLSSSPTSATAAPHGSPKWSRYTSVATRRLQILPHHVDRHIAKLRAHQPVPSRRAAAPQRLARATHTAGIHEPCGSSNSNLLSPLLERTTPCPDDWRNDQGRKKLKRSSMTATPSARRKPRFAKDAPAILEALLTNVRDRTLPPVEAGGPLRPLKVVL